MRRISISQLNTWFACRFRWFLHYKNEWEQGDINQFLASGIAVHTAVEEVLKGHEKHARGPAIVKAALASAFADNEDPRADVAKYLPGAVRAFQRIPAWVFELDDWHVEEELSIRFDVHDTRGEFPGIRTIEVFGRPDFFRLDDDGSIHLLEVKSTSNTQRGPLDYLLFNPQHRYLAVMLRGMYPSRPVYVTYLVVQTGKYAKTVENQVPWLMSQRALDTAEAIMRESAGEVGRLQPTPNYSIACGFCDFKPVCTAGLTGGDGGAILRAEFVKREEPRK